MRVIRGSICLKSEYSFQLYLSHSYVEYNNICLLVPIPNVETKNYLNTTFTPKRLT